MANPLPLANIVPGFIALHLIEAMNSARPTDQEENQPQHPAFLNIDAIHSVWTGADGRTRVEEMGGTSRIVLEEAGKVLDAIRASRRVLK